MRTNCFLFAAAFLSVTAIDVSSQAGEKQYLGGKWPSDQQISMDQIDHSTWNQLLQLYVNGDGNVNYRQWKSNAAHVMALDQYLSSLSQASPNKQSERASQLAYWINAYNAVTIRGIIEVYPTKSIRDHTARLYGYNIWHDLLLVVGDKGVSLDEMEHKILRPMKEPRIHFAIVCASKSCPKLSNQAYLPKTIDKQLNDNAVDFFSSPRNFKYSPGQFQLSSILKWFAEDFGSSQRAQLQYFGPFLADAQARSAATAGRGSISYLGYDWDLNDQKTLQ
ncbi:MAG: hypothetical protein ACI9G1_003409 [Pirellulaceae bacterium]|jgi:hypothetical protein